jgi:hypothetical protein
MQPKDFVTLSISILALLISSIATFITLRQRKYEIQRTIRNQFTDAVKNLLLTDLEHARMETEVKSGKVDGSIYSGPSQKMLTSIQMPDVELRHRIVHVVCL